MGSQPNRSGKKVFAAAVLTVAATYGYFLLFAQFGFLKAVAAAGVDLKLVMTVMGLAGLGGSALAGGLYQARRSRRLLAAGLGVGAAAAAWSAIAGSSASYYAVALLVGVGTSLATVTLASSLRRAVGTGRLGLVIGLGTGLAYACCNLPAVFQAGATTQSIIAMLAAGAGACGARWLEPDAAAAIQVEGDYSKRGVGAWLVILLTLVGLDSAAFYFIQHNSMLRENTWQGAGRLETNAAMHFIAAVLAGLALDRRWTGRTVAAGASFLLLACGLIASGRANFSVIVLLYASGVSIYSTVLVYFPAYSGRPWLAALVYAVAGWIGSAVGIGLAETWPAFPSGLVVSASAAAIFGALLVRHFVRRQAA